MFVFSLAFRREVSLRGGRNSGSTAEADYENTTHETFTKFWFQHFNKMYTYKRISKPIPITGRGGLSSGLEPVTFQLVAVPQPTMLPHAHATIDITN
jgi:hypothetical protein